MILAEEYGADSQVVGSDILVLVQDLHAKSMLEMVASGPSI